MGKGFTITSDLDLGSVLLAGYERHTRQQPQPSSSSESPSKRRKLGPLPRLKIAAITNDTIATLASLAYRVKSLPNSRVAAGVIVGTGCNATIPMKFSDLGAAKAESIKLRYPTAKQTVVNTEITIAGACGPLKPITTTWDRQLDEACARPGFQPLEYMTGGRYVGELIRIIFFEYMTKSPYMKVPPSALPATLVHNYSFSTTFVSAVVARAQSNSELAAELKRRIPSPETSNWTWEPYTAGALRKIAKMVSQRAAGLIAATIVGLLATVGEIVVVDPSTPSSVDGPSDESNARPSRSEKKEAGLSAGSARSGRDGISPAAIDESWNSGPEELVIAYTGGIIQHYPLFKGQCQKYIDKLVMNAGPQKGAKSVLLREATDGGIIGAGVLAGMESGRVA